MTKHFATALFFILVAMFVTTSAAQEPPATPPPAGQDESNPPVQPDAPTPELPSDPRDRLQMAESAFRKAEYGLLVPLLASVMTEPSTLGSSDERTTARELLVVGYFFLAQQATATTNRDELLQQARSTSLDLLRERPEHVLDTLVFPASVVDLFEAVRRDNAAMLDEIIAQRRNAEGNGSSQTIYLEREVTRRPAWVNLLPFGAGQFQNQHLIKGTIFAILQAAGLAVNLVSYWQILRLRDPDTGRYSSEGGLSSDLAKARRWRQALYGGLAGFGAAWIVSAVDGWLNHSKQSVRIRTLDAPPAELDPTAGGAGLDSGLHLGLTLELRW